MKITNLGRCVLAAVLIWLGGIGLVRGDFAPGFQPVPDSMPGRTALAYLAAAICIACGGGMLFRNTAAFATRLLFGWLLVWLLILRVPWMAVSFEVGTWWAASSTAIMTATAWLLYASRANEWDRSRFGFVTGDTGVRIARILFGLALIPIGLAHFLYLDATAPLVGVPHGRSVYRGRRGPDQRRSCASCGDPCNRTDRSSHSHCLAAKGRFRERKCVSVGRIYSFDPVDRLLLGIGRFV